MKKILGLVLVLFFVFSFFPVKAENSAILPVSVVNGEKAIVIDSPVDLFTLGLITDGMFLDSDHLYLKVVRSVSFSYDGKDYFGADCNICDLKGNQIATGVAAGNLSIAFPRTLINNFSESNRESAFVGGEVIQPTEWEVVTVPGSVAKKTFYGKLEIGLNEEKVLLIKKFLVVKTSK